MSSPVIALLDELRGRGVDVEPAIRYRPVDAVSAELRARIGQHKIALLRVLIDGVVEEDAPPQAETEPVRRILASARLLPPTLDVHERPQHGCYPCGRRTFIRVHGGPMWICPTCQGPRDPSGVIERWEAPEPSLREQMESPRRRTERTREEARDA